MLSTVDEPLENTTVTVVGSEVAPSAAVVASGAVTVSSVSETTTGFTPSSGVPPPAANCTDVRLSPGPAKPAPVIVIVSPPSSGPAPGVTASTTGTPKANWEPVPGGETALTVAAPAVVNSAPTVATTLPVPPASLIMDGVVTVISVSDTTVADTPSITREPLVSPVGSKVVSAKVRFGSSNPEPVMVARCRPPRVPPPVRSNR